MFKNTIAIGKGGDVVATNSVSIDCIQVYLYSYSVKLKVYSNLRLQWANKIVINSLAKYIRLWFLN